MQENAGLACLSRLKIVEIASIGPGPFCAMALADLGADILRVDRPGGGPWRNLVTDRGRTVLPLDLKSEAGRATFLDIVAAADVVIEGYRPGVIERLGIGPDVLLARNPRLIVARMTGWGQTGPLAQSAGHDINYLGLTGVMAAMGPKGSAPVPPLNLMGELGGGALYLALGILAAVIEREVSGQGQVIDCAIIDGVASLMAMFTGLLPLGVVTLDRDRGVFSGASPFYRTYACADGEYITIGALEPQFYAELMQRIGAPADMLEAQRDTANWAVRADRLEAIFMTKSRDEWTELLEGTDVCFSPVLHVTEAPDHPQVKARGTYETIDGVQHHAPAPRFSRSTGPAIAALAASARDPGSLLKAWGVEYQ